MTQDPFFHPDEEKWLDGCGCLLGLFLTMIMVLAVAFS